MVSLLLSKVISTLLICRTIAAAATSLAKPLCQEQCGSVRIPYPFGIEDRCYMNESFAVYCDNSSSPAKPYLTSIGMELLGVSMQGYVQVNNISSNCSSAAAPSAEGVNLSGSPFIFLETYNRFTAMGCDNYALLLDQDRNIVGAYLSMCNGTITNTTGCYGLDCYQTTIPPNIKSWETSMQQVFSESGSSGCKSAFMVNQDSSEELKMHDWFNVLRNRNHVPALLQWGTDQGYCYINETSDAFCSGDGYCWREVDQSHLCVCMYRDEEYYSSSIAYVKSRCPEGETCMPRELNNCRLLCVFSTAPGPEGYNCSCPPDFYTYSDNTCDGGIWYSYGKSNRAKTIIIACTSAVGSLLLVIGAWWLFKIFIRRKEIRLKQRFFKRNGGLLLKQQLRSTENNIEQTKIFTSEELEKATDNYHTDRIIGQRGKGTVYKGMFSDGRIVAIKKSKLLDEGQLADFINEVVILSQINHRNVVKLLGCCLETEVPLLVYEFIPNGTLFQHLHDENEGFPMTWEIRLQIATEVANALSCLHSSAASPIYHRDIKSTNILLDEKYRAKVSDFGISKSIAIDQTHVTTRVQGTVGYLDPEYLQSTQFTEKSDVYSFGVVLVELLTGQKPVRNQSVQDKSLATYFLLSMEDNHLFEILDSRVQKEGREDEIAAVAKLARECLNLNGAKRPTMKIVAMKLEAIRASQGASSITTREYEEADYTEVMAPWDAASSSTGSCFNITPPLLTNT